MRAEYQDKLKSLEIFVRIFITAFFSNIIPLQSPLFLLHLPLLYPMLLGLQKKQNGEKHYNFILVELKYAWNNRCFKVFKYWVISLIIFEAFFSSTIFLVLMFSIYDFAKFMFLQPLFMIISIFYHIKL